MHLNMDDYCNLCSGVLQDEIQELELPTDPMEKILVKLAELKQVKNQFCFLYKFNVIV